MTIRVRLTLLYGLLFLVAGAGLLAVSYGLVRHELPAVKVTPVTVQDVRLRAQKLATTSKLDPATRGKLEALASGTDDAIKALIANPSALRSAVTKPLLAELPTAVRADALHKLVTGSLIALGLMGVVAGGLGWVVAGRIVRPIGKITETAQRLSAENLHERIALEGPDDELKRLAGTFDDMLNRLDAAFEGQRRFVANASHELRTPLTIMRTEIDVALRRTDATVDDLRAMAQVVRKTLARSERLVTSLLALAAGQHGPEVTEICDLADITKVALNHHRTRTDQRGLRVDADLSAAPVVGDPGLIERVAENLIDNAVTHNVDAGWVKVRTGLDGDCSILEVVNGGGVLSEDQLQRLFEPFARGSRGGRSTSTGIGLSIVKSVIEAHAGTVSAERLDAGGLRVVARLPASATL